MKIITELAMVEEINTIKMLKSTSHVFVIC